jgi:hypothetical protein
LTSQIDLLEKLGSFSYTITLLGIIFLLTFVSTPVFSYTAVINGTTTECNETAQTRFPYNCELYGAFIFKNPTLIDTGSYITMNSNHQLKFSNSTSLNVKTSILDNNLFLLWEEGNASSANSSDLFFQKSKSNVNGYTFNNAVKIGNIIPFTQPSIFTNNKYIYILWNGIDNSTSNGIFFKKSNDNGSTFNNAVKIGEGNFPVFDVQNSNVYIVWIDQNGSNYDVLFKKSNDNGSTFNNAVKINGKTGETVTDPQLLANGNKVYIIWHGQDSPEKSILHIQTSLDNGSTFRNISNLN